MHVVANLPPITVSSRDLARLEQLLDSPGLRHVPAAIALGRELERATVLPPERMPADVVTMNSQVRIEDMDTGEQNIYTLVFPSDARIAERKVSILAPIGTAMLGYRVGDTVDWPVPAGTRKVRIKEIPYQPEAAGHYDL